MADFLPALDQIIMYQPETGKMFWKIPRGRAIKAGDIVKGAKRSDGYITISVNNCKYLAHRLAWKIATGAFPKFEIDHINGNKSDNRLQNLREATTSQNQWNKKKQANNKSGFKGVSLHKKTGLYRARIKQNKKEISLGYFKNAEQASLAVSAARAKFHGAFANN